MALLEIQWNPSPRELKQFAALWFPAACAVLGALVSLRGGSLWAAACIWGCGAAVSAIGLLRPQAIRPLYVGLLCLTYPIGWVVSHVLLALIFFGMFAPLGLFLRFWGRDPLQRSFDREAASYWTPRPLGRDPKSYFRQF